MALTRTRLIQSNTAIAAIQDPLMVLNSGATTITSDVGLLINRDSGISPNVAIVWQESSKSLVVGLTSNSGSTNSNVFVSQYANVYMGNVYTTGGVYWAGNNSPVSSGGGSGTGTSIAFSIIFGG